MGKYVQINLFGDDNDDGNYCENIKWLMLVES